MVKTDYGSLRTFGFPSNFVGRPEEGKVRVFDSVTYFDIDINLIKNFFPNSRLPYNAFHYAAREE